MDWLVLNQSLVELLDRCGLPPGLLEMSLSEKNIAEYKVKKEILSSHLIISEAISGTVEEIEKYISTSKPAVLYFSTVPVHPDSIDPKQYEKLKEFKRKCSSEGLVETYESLGDFLTK